MSNGTSRMLGKRRMRFNTAFEPSEQVRKRVEELLKEADEYIQEARVVAGDESRIPTWDSLVSAWKFQRNFGVLRNTTTIPSFQTTLEEPDLYAGDRAPLTLTPWNLLTDVGARKWSEDARRLVDTIPWPRSLTDKELERHPVIMEGLFRGMISRVEGPRQPLVPLNDENPDGPPGALRWYRNMNLSWDPQPPLYYQDDTKTVMLTRMRDPMYLQKPD